MSYEFVLYGVEDGVATITLNRPKQLNSLNARLRAEITEAVRRAPEDGARALVLTGAGRGFCSGHDITSEGDMTEVDLGALLREEFEPMLKAVVKSPIPTICAVNGVAAGAGAGLALASDIVFAAKSANFAQVFSRIGLVPGAGMSFWLPRLVGLPRAMGMCLTAESVTAEEARDMGLIWKVCEDDALLDTASELARKLAKGPTLAYRMTKEALRQGVVGGLDEQFSLEAVFQTRAGRSEDFREGLAAFTEKRKPEFKGR
jgi:2-(1,2-epoxy-1,2-dihydrophenyl)acetyl-CoA isomerase